MRAHSEYYTWLSLKIITKETKEQLNSMKKKTLHLMSDKFSKMMFEY